MYVAGKSRAQENNVTEKKQCHTTLALLLMNQPVLIRGTDAFSLPLMSHPDTQGRSYFN